MAATTDDNIQQPRKRPPAKRRRPAGGAGAVRKSMRLHRAAFDRAPTTEGNDKPTAVPHKPFDQRLMRKSRSPHRAASDGAPTTEDNDKPAAIRRKPLDERLRELTDYRLKYGSLDNMLKNDRQLYDYCNHIRRARANSGGSNMKQPTEDQIRKLDALGFNWTLKRQAPKKNFDERLRELTDYRLKYGSLDNMLKNDKQLSDYCKQIRRARANPGGSNMKQPTEDQIRKLDALGFKWTNNHSKAPKKSFDERLRELTDYRLKHGSLDNMSINDRQLYDYCRRIRRARVNPEGPEGTKQPTEDQIRKLDALGFKWATKWAINNKTDSASDLETEMVTDDEDFIDDAIPDIHYPLPSVHPKLHKSILNELNELVLQMPALPVVTEASCTNDEIVVLTNGASAVLDKEKLMGVQLAEADEDCYEPGDLVEAQLTEGGDWQAALVEEIVVCDDGGILVVVKLGTFADKSQHDRTANSHAITLYEGSGLPGDLETRIETIVSASNAGDHYGVLGLTKSCSSQEVRSAFRTVSKLCHPDKSTNTNAEIAFEAIKRARDTLIDNDSRTAYDEERSSKQQKFICSFGVDCSKRPEPPKVCPNEFCPNLVHEVCASFHQTPNGVCPSCNKNGPPPDPSTLLRLEDGTQGRLVPLSRVRSITGPPLPLRGGARSVDSGSDGEGDEGKEQNLQAMCAETPRRPLGSEEGHLTSALYPHSGRNSGQVARQLESHQAAGDGGEMDQILDSALNDELPAEGMEEANDDDQVVSEDFAAIVLSKATFVGEPLSSLSEAQSPIEYRLSFPERKLGFKIRIRMHGALGSSRSLVHITEVNESGPAGSEVLRHDTIVAVNETPIMQIISDNFRNPTAALVRHIQRISESDNLVINFCRYPEGFDHSSLIAPPGRSGSESGQPQRKTGQGFSVEEDFQQNREGAFFVGKSVKVMVGVDSYDATVIRCLPGNKFVVQFVDFNRRSDQEVDHSQLMAVEPLPDDDPEPIEGRRDRPPTRRTAARAARIIQHQESRGSADSIVPFYLHRSHRRVEKLDRSLQQQRTVISDHHDPQYDHRNAKIERQDGPLNIGRIITSFEGGDEVMRKLKEENNLLWNRGDEAIRERGFDVELEACSPTGNPVSPHRTVVIHGMKYRNVRDGLGTCQRKDMGSYPCGGKIIFRDGVARIVVEHCNTCRVHSLRRLSREQPNLGLTTEMIDAVIVKLLECKEFGVIVDRKRGVREVYRPLTSIHKTTHNIEQVAMIVDAVRRGDMTDALRLIEDINEGRVPRRNTYFLSTQNGVVSFANGVPRHIGTVDIHQYHMISVTCFVREGDVLTKRIQRLPAAALINRTFNGPPPSDPVGHVTDHIDGTRRQNNPQNLNWTGFRRNCGQHPSLGRQALLSSLPSDDDGTFNSEQCYVCDGTGTEGDNNYIICSNDNCGRGFHSNCCQVDVSRAPSDWTCPFCRGGNDTAEAQRARNSALRLYRERMSRRQAIQEPDRGPDDQVLHDVQGQPLLLGEPERVDEPEEDDEMVQDLIDGADDEMDQDLIEGEDGEDEIDEGVENPQDREEPF